MADIPAQGLSTRCVHAGESRDPQGAIHTLRRAADPLAAATPIIRERTL